MGRREKEGNEYVYRVNRSEHNYEFGVYLTHIYAYDEKGKESKVEIPIHNIVNTTVKQGWVYIDWDTVKRYGDIDDVILRITAHPNGSYIEDTKFANNLANCRRLKIPFGVYI